MAAFKTTIAVALLRAGTLQYVSRNQAPVTSDDFPPALPIGPMAVIKLALLPKLVVATTALIVALCSTALGQERFDLRIVQSGHSLTDPIPPVLRALAIAGGAEPDIVIDRSTIPGSPMDYRWEHTPDPGSPNARAEIGNYDLLVLTERIPLSNTIQWHNSPSEALRWFDHAYRNGAGGGGAKTILYATWVEIDSGPEFENPYDDPEGYIPWRQRLPLEFARWVEIADFVNSNRPDGSAPMRIIPATLVLAAAYDDIVAGKAPGLNDLSQLFTDNIHLNDAGAYLVALTHYAVIYEQDPRGLPSDIGQPVPVPAELANWMQALVWEVVGTYQASAKLRERGNPAFASELFPACLWAALRQETNSCS